MSEGEAEFEPVAEASGIRGGGIAVERAEDGIRRTIGASMGFTGVPLRDKRCR